MFTSVLAVQKNKDIFGGNFLCEIGVLDGKESFRGNFPRKNITQRGRGFYGMI